MSWGMRKDRKCPVGCFELLGSFSDLDPGSVVGVFEEGLRICDPRDSRPLVVSGDFFFSSYLIVFLTVTPL